MNLTIEDRLRRHYVTVTDQLELPERTIDEVLSRSDHGANTTVRWRRGLMVAATVVLIAGAVGLIATRRNGESAPAAPPPATQPSGPLTLADTDGLAASDWVAATVLPDDAEWLYANRRWYAGDPANNRVIAYGQRVGDGTGEQLWIEIDTVAPTSSTSIIDIDGIEWGVDNPSPDWWSATREVGTSTVNVRGQGEINRNILQGLVVIDETGLPFAPLGGPNDAAEVARTNLGDDVYRYDVQESNDYYCNWVRDGTGGLSGGCGGLIEPSAVITIDGGSTEQLAGADVVTAVRAGSVSVTVERVEVDFADGTTLTVEPNNLSNQFDRRFWIAAATISTDSQTGIPVTEETVSEARAYDIDDNLLGAISPPWIPGDPTASVDNE